MKTRLQKWLTNTPSSDTMLRKKEKSVSKSTFWGHGFTVLEFLIVIAIMCILISIALASLTSSRAKSIDEKKVTDLKTAALGLEQYKQVCGTYPAEIDPNQQCDALGTNTLTMFIPNIESYHFNDPAYGFYYTPLSYDINHKDHCDGFHLGVELKTNIEGTVAVGDSNVDSVQDQICTADSAHSLPILGKSNVNMFDIFK
jgi:prepilin-type N-terminal cleavage/methylation domain-containing protein